MVGLFVTSKFERLVVLMKQMDDKIAQIGKLGPRPLTPPFDFAYIDTPRVNALYSQFAPVLREQQRTVQAEGSVGVGAKAGNDIASLSATATKRRSEVSQMNAVPESVERRASSLIEGLRDRGQLRIYSTPGDWIMLKIAAPLDRIRESLNRVVFEGDTSKPLPEVEEVKEELADLEDKLKTELRDLRGQVVFQGKWRVMRNASGVQLEHAFNNDDKASAPQREPLAVFRCTVPLTAVPAGTVELNARIFGTVIKSSPPVIELAPLAIFY